MMMSFFWNGYVLQDFIFKSFNTKTFPGFFSILIALISAGILYEGMYLLKKVLLGKFLAIRRRAQINARNLRAETGHSDSEDVNILPRNSLINDERFNELDENLRLSEEASLSQCTRNRQEFSYLFLSSVLHGCYVFVGYTLMNAVMTFNVWMLVAVCLGIGLGYLVFRTDDNTLISDNDYFQRETSIEAYAQLHNENDKTDENDEGGHHDHNNAAGGGAGARASPLGNKDRRDNDSGSGTSSKKSPNVSERVRNRNSSKASSSGSGNANNANRQADRDLTTTEKEAPAGQVIVVGAQVHSNYQQSV